MRTLASIKEIAALHPIEGKNRIELAIIDGWSVIVKKNEFQVGDKCVYCEIDSVLPEKPEFEFLRNKNFRIKTMKMGGVISQGICFPLSIHPVEIRSLLHTKEAKWAKWNSHMFLQFILRRAADIKL